MVRSNVILVSVFIFLFAIPCLSSKTPTYTIDLDDPPELRWKQVATHYKSQINAIISKALQLFHVPEALLKLLQTQAPAILAYLPKDYGQEIVGISRDAGVSLANMILVNVLYDVTAACTSIVAQTNDNKIIHARNLDYRLADELRNLTIIVEAKQRNATVFRAVTFAGMIGMLTGQKPNSFSITLDQRNKGDRWENLYEMLLDRQAHFDSFEIRRVLEMPGLDYAGALREFQVSVMMAPCYLILGGVKPGEGAVITRDRESEISVRFLDTDKGTWYVLETNYDWWVPPPSKDDRRDPAIKHMNKIGRGNTTLSALYEVLSTPPVCRPQGTVYTVLMSASDPQMLSSVIRDAESPCNQE